VLISNHTNISSVEKQDLDILKNQVVISYKFFIQISMKKRNFDIHLVNAPSKMRSKGNNQLNKIQLCNKSKGFNVVDAFLLRELF